mgnify:CR=1 FL=1
MNQTAEPQGPQAADGGQPVQEVAQDSGEMSLESLEQHIQEAEELHRTLSRRLDETARD